MPEFRQNRSTKRWGSIATERARGTAATLVTLALLAGCGERNQPRSRPHSGPPDQRAKLLTIPDEYKNRSNPLPATEANLEEGHTRYGEYCAGCHGCDGKADTRLGRNLYPRASDLTSPHVGQHTDGQLYWMISQGIRYSGMPAGRKLHTEEQIWQLVLYLRQLPGEATISPPHQPASYAPVQQTHSEMRRQALQ